MLRDRIGGWFFFLLDIPSTFRTAPRSWKILGCFVAPVLRRCSALPAATFRTGLYTAGPFDKIKVKTGVINKVCNDELCSVCHLEFEIFKVLLFALGLIILLLLFWFFVTDGSLRILVFIWLGIGVSRLMLRMLLLRLITNRRNRLQPNRLGQ